MYFQFSPIRADKKAKPAAAPVEEESVEVLNLAPFSPNPRINFNNVPVGQSAMRQLLIRNPTKEDIQLFISKSVPEELDFTYSWTENVVPKNNGDILLEMVWKPQKEGSFCHSFTLENGKRLRRDVLISFKAFSKKQPKKAGAKAKGRQARKVSPPKSPTVVCPPKARRISPTKQFSPKRSHVVFPQVVLSDPAGREALICKPESDFNLRRETFTITTASAGKDAVLSPVFSDDSLDRSRNSSEFHKLQYRRVLTPSQTDNVALDLTTHRRFEEKLHELDFSAHTDIAGFKDFNLSSSTFIKDASFQSDYHKQYKNEISPERGHLKGSSDNLFGSKESLSSHKENLASSRENLLAAKDNLSLTQKIKNFNFSPPFPVKLKAQEVQSPDLEQKLQNLDFTPINSTVSHQFHCSTEQKSIHLNISSSTYVKDSSFKENATFTRCNSPLSSLRESVSAKDVIEANLWVEPPPLPAVPARRPPKRRILCQSDVSPAKSPKLRQSQASPKVLKSSHENLFNWSKRDVNYPFRVAKSTSGLKSSSTELIVSNESKVIWKNPFLMAATNMIDPFMTSNLFVDEEWIDQQENYFKKWLNALLTPPEELQSQECKIDVAKVWQNVKRSENSGESVAPTKEAVSLNYHKSLGRLNGLRRAAAELYRNPEMVNVLSKVMKAVDIGKIEIRSDRDIFLNLGLRSQILSLILSYNSLWLRIGLETVYNVNLDLNSNSDVMGLSTFLAQNLFKSPALLKKYGSVMAGNYYKELNKHFLKKFFALVYFLDQAKNRQLIAHDPCLFNKSGEVKESRQILTIFTREAIAAIGDITKYLKYYGYVVTHKQTFIHEFDYAVKRLGGDLRDGVRLARVMEIILLQDRQLTDQLRVPAISRLQKIHNVKLAFTALEKAGFKILYEIEPKDIVDGHKEKTLSFLWQIIYKFEAPLMVKSTTTIQKWFRSLPICLKRLKLRRVREKREKAARTIEKWYLNVKLSEKLSIFTEKYRIYLDVMKRERAAVKIQSCYRRYRCRTKFLQIKQAVIKIQSYSRRYLVNNYYQHRIKAAVVLQKYTRRYLAQKSYKLLLNRYRMEKLAIEKISAWYKATKLMLMLRNRYESLRKAAIVVQNRYRALLLMRKQRFEFLLLKKSTIVIQQQFRAQKSMQSQRNQYLELRRATIVIQNRFRANKLTKVQRERFQLLKQATIVIQCRFRALILMRNQRESFLSLKKSTLVIQQRFRALKSMKNERNRYLELRRATIAIQNRFRANQLMKIQRHQYESLRKATIIIQNRYRALKLMKNQRSEFESLKKATIVIQQRFRAMKSMRLEQSQYKSLKSATITVQNRYRALILMRNQRMEFLFLQKATIVIQQRFRAQKSMLIQRNKYLQLRRAAIVIQNRFRANKLMKDQRNDFQLLRKAAIIVQRRFKAKLLMKHQSSEYANLKWAAICIQRRFRAKKSMQLQRNYYKNLQKAVVTVQSRWRALKLMQKTRLEYKNLCRATVFIQSRFRAMQAMRKDKSAYDELKSAVLVIQRRYRARKLMQVEVNKYKKLQKAASLIQNRWRAKKLMQVQASEYESLKKAVLVIQSRYRALILMRNQKIAYESLRSATISIQQRFRARNSMKIQRNRYLELRKAAITIQNRFRANKLMKIERARFLDYRKLLKATTVVQNRFRANKLMKIQRQEFQLLRKATIVLQRRFRAVKLMRNQRDQYDCLKKSAILIQQRFRAIKMMKLEREKYLKLRAAVILVQNRFRANRSMKIARNQFDTLKKATIIVQIRYRAFILMRNQRNEYNRLRSATILIQQSFRALNSMRKQRSYFESLKKCTIIIQQRYRAKLQGRIERNYYLKLKLSVKVVEKQYKALKLMREQREYFQKLKKCAISMQIMYRNKKLTEYHRNHFILLKKSVITIQQRWRAIRLMRIERQKYQTLLRSVNTIKSYYKACKLAQKVRADFLVKRNAVIQIQKLARGYLIRKKYADYFSAEAQAARKQIRAETRAARHIQAFWRGYKVRRGSSQEVLAIRQRCHVANQLAVPENTLANRGQEAITVLTNAHSTLLQVIKALSDFEFITRRCRKTCISTCGFLPQVMYVLLAATARSLPEMEICTHATRILINYCKLPETKSTSFVAHQMHVVILLMMHWCDKESPLFPSLCTLLWLFAHNDDWRKQLVNSPNFEQQFCKIGQMCERKYKMVQKIGVKGSSVFEPFKNLPLPGLFPDWGLDYKHRPYAFSNSMFAFKCLKKLLLQDN